MCAAAEAAGKRTFIGALRAVVVVAPALELCVRAVLEKGYF